MIESILVASECCSDDKRLKVEMIFDTFDTFGKRPGQGSVTTGKVLKNCSGRSLKRLMMNATRLSGVARYHTFELQSERVGMSSTIAESDGSHNDWTRAFVSSGSSNGTSLAKWSGQAWKAQVEAEEDI